MTKRPLLRAACLALPALVAVSRPAATACPTCAGAAEEKAKAVWPLVGAFLLVPPAVLGTLAVLIRRETRSSPPGPGI